MIIDLLARDLDIHTPHARNDIHRQHNGTKNRQFSENVGGLFLPLVHADVDLREIVGMGAGEEPTRTVMTTLAKLAIACREKMREERV